MTYLEIEYAQTYRTHYWEAATTVMTNSGLTPEQYSHGMWDCADILAQLATPGYSLGPVPNAKKEL